MEQTTRKKYMLKTVVRCEVTLQACALHKGFALLLLLLLLSSSSSSSPPPPPPPEFKEKNGNSAGTREGYFGAAKYQTYDYFFLLFWQSTLVRKKPNNKCNYLDVALYRKSNPITGLDRPWSFQKFEAPRFQDKRHMKAVSLSALRTGDLCRPGNIPGTPFC